MPYAISFGSSEIVDSGIPADAMKEQHPVVSIGLPVYNGREFLPRCLDSLLAQSFTDFELVLSDNASTDNTWQIVSAYAARDPRIRSIRQSENRGPLWNFEFVLQESKAELFMWAAHDDAWSPNYIECLVEALQSHPLAVLAYPSCIYIDASGNAVHGVREPVLASRWNPLNVFFRPTAYWPRWYNAFAFYLQPINWIIYGLYRRQLLPARRPLFVAQTGTACYSDSRFLAELFFEHSVCAVPECYFYYYHRERSISDYPDKPSLVSGSNDLYAYLLEAVPKRYGVMGYVFKAAVRAIWTTYSISALVVAWLTNPLRCKRHSRGPDS
jgi:glycosyltransferase involved in cell wall biosynthesis